MLRDRVHLVHRLLRSAGRDKEVHPRDLQHSSVDSDGWFDFVVGGVEYLAESVENRVFDVGGGEFALADKQLKKIIDLKLTLSSAARRVSI